VGGSGAGGRLVCLVFLSSMQAQRGGCLFHLGIHQESQLGEGPGEAVGGEANGRDGCSAILACLGKPHFTPPTFLRPSSSTRR
jgi:hypothetical protein